MRYRVKEVEYENGETKFHVECAFFGIFWTTYGYHNEFSSLEDAAEFIRSISVKKELYHNAP